MEPHKHFPPWAPSRLPRRRIPAKDQVPEIDMDDPLRLSIGISVAAVRPVRGDIRLQLAHDGTSVYPVLDEGKPTEEMKRWHMYFWGADVLGCLSVFFGLIVSVQES